MQIGLGVLHLSPDEFWSMTLTEFYCACDGMSEFQGGRNTEPLSRSELDELMELYPD